MSEKLAMAPTKENLMKRQIEELRDSVIQEAMLLNVGSDANKDICDYLTTLAAKMNDMINS